MDRCASMARYTFELSNGGSFVHQQELSSDEAAWRQAILTVRDIETSLSSGGGEWSLVVSREENAIYRIDVRAERLG